VSLGCAKNREDAEIMLRSILDAGLVLAPSADEADVVVINTCAFIGDAQRESLDAILSAADRKARGRCRAVVVAGCLAQRHRHALQRELPEVDAFVGLDQVPRLGPILTRVAAGGRNLFCVGTEARAVLDPPADRPLLSAGPYAFVRLADGCNHRCAFCAIPLIRGRHRSRRPDAIVRECEGLLARGVRELNLISQDVLDYGRDLGGRPLLPGLIRRLDRLGGRFWIRLLYGHPESVHDDLLDALDESARVCRYLDLPIQHAHPAVLRAMGRRGDPAGLRRLFRRIRQRVPGVVLRTTCLTGFPGETEPQFQCLLDLVRSVRFDHLGVFAYSREEGTPAAERPDQVPASLAQRRRRVLLAAQRPIVDSHAAALVNAEFDALLEQPLGAGRIWLARTARQAPEVDGSVRVRGTPASAAAGDFIRVRITGQAGCDLTAAAVETRH
jgi:ribosomal protein S12 methylthiotransferase